MNKLLCPPVFALSAVLALASGILAAEEGPAAEHPRWEPAIAPIEAKNLLPNSSFELGASGWASLGKRTAWGAGVTGLYGEVQAGGAYDGGHCLRIDLGPCKTPVTYYDGYPAGRVVQHAPLAANIGWMDVVKGETYTLSAYMRADRPGVTANLVFRFGTKQIPWPSPTERTQAVTLTDQWARYAFTLPAEERDVCIALGPDMSAAPDVRATVWLDAVQIEKAPAPTDFVPREPVEVGFCTERFGNVFDVNEPVQLKVYGSNRTGEAAAIKVEARLEDYFGTARPASSFELRIPPRSDAAGFLPLGAAEPGFYRGTVAWTVGGIQHREALKMAAIQLYGHDDSPFGINHAPTTPESCEMLMKAGLVWARDWSVDWNQLEPEEGKLSFEMSDAQIDRVRDIGMRMMALLPPFGSTRWASEAPDDLEARLPKDIGTPPEWARISFAPKDPQKLYNFIERAVLHYRGRLNVWEFCNEPVNTEYSLPSAAEKLPGANYTVADYYRLLKPAYATMKKADPTCTVVASVCVGELNLLLQQTEEFARMGGMECLDAFNLHPYGLFTKTPEGFIPFMEKMNAILDGAGAGDKPFWITEYGYYGQDDKAWTPWVPLENSFSVKFSEKSERAAADRLMRYHTLMLAQGVERFFLHQGMGSDVNNAVFSYECPLWGGLNLPTKAYAAQAALANLLGPRPKYAGPLAKPESGAGREAKGVYGYAFQCGDRAVLAAWALDDETGGTQWRLAIPRSCRAVNVVGASMKGKEVALGESPVYITSGALRAEEVAKACRLRAAR